MKFRVTALCMALATGAAFAGTAPTSDQVQAALLAAAPAKLLVAEGFAKTGHWAGSNAEAGFAAPADAPARIDVGPNGVITIAFTGPSITLTPADGGNGRVEWSCAGSDFADGALPVDCR